MATQSRRHGRANKDESATVMADAQNWPSLISKSCANSTFATSLTSPTRGMRG